MHKLTIHFMGGGSVSYSGVSEEQRRMLLSAQTRGGIFQLLLDSQRVSIDLDKVTVLEFKRL